MTLNDAPPGVFELLATTWQPSLEEEQEEHLIRGFD
jgi:hypothetical protein